MTTTTTPKAYIQAMLEAARAADQTPSAPEVATPSERQAMLEARMVAPFVTVYVVQGCLPSGLPKFVTPRIASRVEAEAIAASMNAQGLNGLTYTVKEVYA